MKKFPTVLINQTIREAMLVINNYSKGVCYILDGSLLVGLVTDGDIRRSLLSGATLTDRIETIINREFVSFKVGTDSKTIRDRFTKRVRHIPLVDDMGNLVDVADPHGNFRISVLEPFMTGNELKYVTECIETNWISSQGKFVSAFERIFSEFHNHYEAVAVSNGTVALHLSLMAFGIGEGDEVIVPDLTFAASANSVIHAGARPVFCEIDRDTWCLSITEVEKLIGPMTKAIMPVNLYGQPCELNKLKKLCDFHNLLMIEDCAESLGSKLGERKVGTFGHASTFSFFGNKTISTGEGGMVLFKDAEVANFARRLRDHGMSKEKRYWHDVIGYNYRITNLQAAIGVAQMEKFNLILEKKLKIARIYDKALCDSKLQFQLPCRIPQNLHSNWLYGVILPSVIDRQEIIDELLHHGIETRPFFYSLHAMPPYKDFSRSSQMDHSKEISSKGLSLPSSVNLSDDEVLFVAQKLIDCITGKLNG